jgi:hypothetical protein
VLVCGFKPSGKCEYGAAMYCKQYLWVAGPVLSQTSSMVSVSMGIKHSSQLECPVLIEN